MKYRKIQAEIEAFQMTAAAANQNPRLNPAWPDWMVEAFEKEAGSKGALWAEVLPQPRLMIGSSVGVTDVNENDWIIRGEEGLHVMSDEVFSKLYEPVVLVECIGEAVDA